MSRPPARGCTCVPAARAWDDTPRCATCGQRVLESQLKPVLLQALCGGTGLVLWPNPSGHAAFRNKDGSEYHVNYGVGNPPGGGGDFVGLYEGRYVEVETKTADGRLSPAQRARQQLVTRLNGIYAVVRSVGDAQQLLERLRSEVSR